MNDSDLIPGTPYKIVRIYLKGASSEVPHMAGVPREAIAPHIGVDMQTLAEPAWPGALECVLRISLHARLEGKTVFLIEVSVAGVFELNVGNMEEAHRFVRKVAPSILFPFARKDLASLAVAAGFQPVLLDHIDFDTMLLQVIKSQRLSRSTAPLRLDVIAAKPVQFATPAQPAVSVMPSASPAPLAADKKEKSAWQDTQPGALVGPATSAAGPAVTPSTAASDAARNSASAEREQPLLAGSRQAADKARVATRSKPELRSKAVGWLCIAAAGSVVAWWLQAKPPRPADTAVANRSAVTAVTAKPPVSTPPQLAPASTLTPAPTAAFARSAELMRAIDLSQERLADQPANWFTLDLGVSPADTLPATWFPAVANRPVFVKIARNGSIHLLYGVFPTKAAAEQARVELTRPVTAVTIGSL